jgi:uncharacterized protein with WD repeat
VNITGEPVLSRHEQLGGSKIVAVMRRIPVKLTKIIPKKKKKKKKKKNGGLQVATNTNEETAPKLHVVDNHKAGFSAQPSQTD